MRAKTVVRNNLEKLVVWNIREVPFMRSMLLLKRILVEMFREDLRDVPDVRFGEDEMIGVFPSLRTGN